MSTSLVTVFGGTGFVGRHTVRALAKAGKRIRVAVRHPHQGFFLPPMGTVGQIALIKCDVREADQVAAAAAGADAIINLTGILYPRGGQDFEAVHVDAADAIAKAAKAVGARTLVHVSAIGADKDSESGYAASKGEGEARVRDAFPGAAIVRPSLVFGPEDEFFNRFAAPGARAAGTAADRRRPYPIPAGVRRRHGGRHRVPGAGSRAGRQGL
ncbi:MAG: NAD(P)H-binding protein [Rhizomicrobium sp.]